MTKIFLWMSDEIKTLIKKKNWMYQKQTSGNLDYNALNPITADISNAVITFDFSGGNIIKFIKALDPKAHGHRGRSILMVKPCAFSISKPSYYFQKVFGKVMFPQ